MSANISLIGNLGKAPETKITDKGTFIASFSMASNSVRNTAETGRDHCPLRPKGESDLCAGTAHI